MRAYLVMSNSLRSHGLWPARLLCPWDSPECLLILLAQGCLLGFLLSAILLSFLTFVPGCTLSLFHTPFLLILYSSSLPFSLRTLQFSLLEMVPQPECWFACLSRFECHVGGGEQQWNERNIPHEFLFQLCTGFAEIEPRGSQIDRNTSKASTDGSYRNQATDFPGGPVAKTLYSQCRGPGSIPGWGTRSHMLRLRLNEAK